MARLILILNLIFIIQGTFAYGDEQDRYPAGDDRTSISELIPNFSDLKCEPKCEGRNLECAQYNDVQSCTQSARTLGCYWSCK